MVFGGANDAANNGDLQDAAKNVPLMDGSHTSGADEHIQLNESSLWQGGRANRLNPKASEAFPKIRSLLLESNGTDGAQISEAEKLAQDSLIGIPRGMPGYSTLGDLYLHSIQKLPVTNYRRQLDLQTGIVRITYTMGGVHYTREIFASVPQQVIVMRLTADRKGALNFDASMDRPADFAVGTRGQNTLVLREGDKHESQIRFAGEATFLANGGSVVPEGSKITVRNADSVTALIAAATDFKGGPFQGGDPEAECEHALYAATTQSFSSLLAAQEAVYQPVYRRMSLQLGRPDPATEALPTDERVKRVSAGGGRPLAATTLLPVRALSPYCIFSAGWPARELAGYLGRRHQQPLGIEVDDQYQYGDELLARRANWPFRHDVAPY